MLYYENAGLWKFNIALLNTSYSDIIDISTLKKNISYSDIIDISTLKKNSNCNLKVIINLLTLQKQACVMCTDAPVFQCIFKI